MADGINNGAENTNTSEVTTNEQSNDLATLQAELEKMKAENAKLKSAQSNASADASKYKKELAARMSEEERKASEVKELMEQLKAENAALKRSQALAEHKAGLVGLGFEGELAEKAATAFLDNDFTAFAGHLKDFVAAHDKAVTAEGIRNTPRPGVGGVGTAAITQEQFDNMGYSERLKVYNEQPELYKTLTQK